MSNYPQGVFGHDLQRGEGADVQVASKEETRQVGRVVRQPISRQWTIYPNREIFEHQLCKGEGASDLCLEINSQSGRASTQWKLRREQGLNHLLSECGKQNWSRKDDWRGNGQHRLNSSQDTIEGEMTEKIESNFYRYLKLWLLIGAR